MKVKVWELSKEDMEKIASRIMIQTLKELVTQGYLYQIDANEFSQTFSPVAFTPDSVDESIRKSMFSKENLNAHCIFKVVKIK